MNRRAHMTFARPAEACQATRDTVRAWMERRLDDAADADRDHAAEDRAAELIDIARDRSGRNDYGYTPRGL